jgi:hypothetical protein
VRSVFLTILVAGLSVSPAGAWDEAGHKMTAEIAYELLSDKDQQHVVAILRAHPRFREDFIARMPEEIANAGESENARWLFAQASIWPDIIQNLGEEIRRQYHHGTWHYINLPVYLTEQDEKEFASQLDHNMSPEFVPPLRHELNLIQALKGNLLVWRDATAPDAARAIALCWILHLTGDIHEPLHNVALFSRIYFPEGDRGGNLIAVRRDDDLTNLHAVWDGLSNRLDDLAPDEDARKTLANDVADIHSIDDWARDHHHLAMKFAYSEELKRKLRAQDPGKRNPQITLSAEYLAAAEEIASSRIIIAGHRIAALIRN